MWVEYGFNMCRRSRGSGSLDSLYWPNTLSPLTKRSNSPQFAHCPVLFASSPPGYETRYPFTAVDKEAKKQGRGQPLIQTCYNRYSRTSIRVVAPADPAHKGLQRSRSLLTCMVAVERTSRHIHSLPGSRQLGDGDMLFPVLQLPNNLRNALALQCGSCNEDRLT